MTRIEELEKELEALRKPVLVKVGGVAQKVVGKKYIFRNKALDKNKKQHLHIPVIEVVEAKE